MRTHSANAAARGDFTFIENQFLDPSAPFDVPTPIFNGGADQLFRDLDQQQVDAGSHNWTTEVLGIHFGQHDVWVQLALVGDVPNNVVLHLAQHADTNSAIERLKTWAEESLENHRTGGVLDCR